MAANLYHHINIYKAIFEAVKLHRKPLGNLRIGGKEREANGMSIIWRQVTSAARVGVGEKRAMAPGKCVITLRLRAVCSQATGGCAIYQVAKCRHDWRIIVKRAALSKRRGK